MKIEYENLEPRIIQKVKETGREAAKKMVRKFGSNFNTTKINPNDIALVFHPIDYIVFNGMNDGKKFDNILFYSKEPQSTNESKTIRSIENVLKKGNIEFTTIRIDEKGNVSKKKVYSSKKQTSLPW